MANVMIIDDNGVIWSSSSPDAEDKGLQLIEAVTNGNRKQFVKKYLGESWDGDLVLVSEIARTR